MAYKYSGRIIRAGKAWVDNNQITHPANWASAWDADTKAAIGVVWEDDPNTSFDSRFYWSQGVAKSLDDINEVDENNDPILDQDGNQVVTLGLKSIYKAQTKTTAGSLLAPTDWYVVRYTEDNTATIPTNVSTYRAAVRTASGTIETAIDNAADLTAFIALFDVPVDADGNPTGNAPINDWPEEV